MGIIHKYKGRRNGGMVVGERSLQIVKSMRYAQSASSLYCKLLDDCGWFRRRLLEGPSSKELGISIRGG